MPPELHSICELAAVCRKTAGHCVPPKLVGASTTVVGSRMYLFGGRLASENEIVADLYVFDLETCHWDKISPVPYEDVARARYFHSADTWKNQLVIFGGMGYDPDSLDPDNLCVLNDIRFFDIASRRWSAPSLSPTPGIVPRARYAHLSSVTGDRLFIIGGQDIGNAWLTDICIYDFLDGNWSENRSFHRRCSSYGSMAVTSNQRVCFLDDERRTSVGRDGAGTSSPKPETENDGQPAESLVNIPFSCPVDSENPSDIYLYSNNNFADGNHGLELISPLPTTGFKITTPTATTSGTTSSPGLRFPSGAILGTHLIISGIYFYQRYQSFAIWVLDLQTMEWSRFNPGRAVESGSWSRGCVWTDANRFILFGNRHGDLADRFLSWDHVAVIDLEAFGIYQPPPLKVDLPMQMFGLAALEEEVLADFEIVCDDGQAISCSRRLLEDRWPWFKEQMRRIKQVQDSTVHILLPKLLDSLPDDQRPDSRLTSSSLNLLEPYPITRAFIQYFYSLALLTPLQRAPAVLTRLLVLATDYDVPHLQSLVKHTMHWTLSKSTAAGVYEAAQLCDCRSLQIRALKSMLSSIQSKSSVALRPNSHRSDASGHHIILRPSGASLASGIADGSTRGTRHYDESTLYSSKQGSIMSQKTEAEMNELVQLLSGMEPTETASTSTRSSGRVRFSCAPATEEAPREVEPQTEELSFTSKPISLPTYSALARLRPRKTSASNPVVIPQESTLTPKEQQAAAKRQRKTRTGELARALKERPPQPKMPEDHNKVRDKREPAVMYGGVCGFAM